MQSEDTLANFTSCTEVVFEGKPGLEYVNTKNHPPMHFSTESWLTIGVGKNLVECQGELHRVGKSNQYACMLGLTLQLNLETLGIPIPLNGMEKEFEAVITQAILQRDKN